MHMQQVQSVHNTVTVCGHCGCLLALQHAPSGTRPLGGRENVTVSVCLTEPLC
jgi:hypothetical protein